MTWARYFEDYYKLSDKIYGTTNVISTPLGTAITGTLLAGTYLFIGGFRPPYWEETVEAFSSEKRADRELRIAREKKRKRETADALEKLRTARPVDVDDR